MVDSPFRSAAVSRCSDRTALVSDANDPERLLRDVTDVSHTCRRTRITRVPSCADVTRPRPQPRGLRSPAHYGSRGDGAMSYDALAESLRLLDGAPPAQVARLSRRVRFLPLAVDRDGDVAATCFLRRGVSGAALLDTHLLERTADRWRLLGGGGGPGDHALLPRPGMAESGLA